MRMLHMNGIIRARRRELGMTQEQMAQRLGVSAGAVSKWEQGASYPDIALLPAIARLLRTDINTLMGYEQMLTREDAAQMASQVVEMTKDEGINAAFALAQEMARTYPDSGALLYMLAATMEGRMIMRGMSAEERERYSAVLEGWYERASTCEDAQIRESAAHLLAGKYLTRGETDRAKAMMEKLPPEPSAARWMLEVNLLHAQGEDEEARAYLQKRLFVSTGEMQQILLRLEQAELDAGETERAQQMAKLLEGFVSLMGMQPYMGHLAQLMPALSRRDVQASIGHTRAMLEALRTPWSPGESLPYDHAGIKKGGQSAGDMLAGIIREMEESETYAFLRNDEEFMALLAAYKPA